MAEWVNRLSVMWRCNSRFSFMMDRFVHRQLSRDLDGNTTDVLVQMFSDRVLVLITQLGKVGTLVILLL